MAARWDPDSIKAAMLRWHREVGEAPSAADWSGDRAHPHWLRNPGAFPSRMTVERNFDGWSAALAAAGLEGRPAGRPGQRSPEERKRLQRERAAVRRSIAAAERLGRAA